MVDTRLQQLRADVTGDRLRRSGKAQLGIRL